jgi:hypothetical protein
MPGMQEQTGPPLANARLLGTWRIAGGWSESVPLREL